MRRFFIEEKDIKENQVTIKGDEARHIAQVLRLEEKDKIKVFTGGGREYLTEIIQVNKKEVIGRILEESRLDTEPPIEITLLQGLPKSDKMDFIVQKVTELGVKRIIPVITQRTVVKLNEEKARARRNRWQRIALEAAKQSGRAIVPEVREVIPFIQALDNLNRESLNLIPWEEETSTSLKEVLKRSRIQDPGSKITVFIGPEGGFTPEEVRAAKKKGAIPVSLGPRLLRTETAGLVTLAMVLYELGDMG
ncbi:16S rRNA (uracil(1498)-N(3))-methyltransferase [bacterium]|nr:16S rRNA (uracil(1498)-N(3))-methyltransferase [bacterium]MBU4561155.1 16S rRNA (uracil(1498)-N(3))-methyltransferase [bacterium]MCG2676071.1 16S rRNA (uracil(1498)-N(3))-methyltransferase [bacterium]MCG2677270.1 16S rRNA (uracil(1498)-N(3))-methyltransferase [bacterium]